MHHNHDYDEGSDTLFIHSADPKGEVSTAIVYQDDFSIVSVDTDEANKQTGIKVVGLMKLMNKFKANPGLRAEINGFIGMSPVGPL